MAHQSESLPYPLLTRLMASTRIPNALLLHGANMTTLFDAMSHVVTQLNGSDPIAPQTDDALQEPVVDALVIHPPGDHIKLALILTMQDRIRYGASQSKGHCIVMIHNAGRLTTSAANALLTSMETPPERTLFICSAHHRQQLLPTIRSRCQCLHIAPSPDRLAQQYHDDVATITETLPYITAQSWLEKPLLEATCYLQTLPRNMAALRTLIRCWQWELYQDFTQLNPREKRFLEKIIEIIGMMTYNLNLPLQLLAAAFELEEVNT